MFLLAHVRWGGWRWGGIWQVSYHNNPDGDAHSTYDV